MTDPRKALDARLRQRLNRELRGIQRTIRGTQDEAELAELVDLVKREIPAMAREVANDIETWILELVDQEHRGRILDNRNLSSRWPWPETPYHKDFPDPPNPGWFPLATLRWRTGSRPTLEDEIGNVDLRKVARWARDTLNETSGIIRMGDQLAAAGEENGEISARPPTSSRLGPELVEVYEKARPGSRAPPRQWLRRMQWVPGEGPYAGRRLNLPLGGLVLLYQAKEGLEIHPAPPQAFPGSTDRATKETMTGLVGSHPEALRQGKLLRPDPSDPTGLEFKWHDGTQLVLPFDEGVSPLVAVGRRYGNAAVRDLTALFLFTWAAGASANEAIWWWPEEHLDVLGLSDTKEARRRLKRWLDNMSRARLTARYSTGKPLTGSLVTEVVTDGSAYKVHMHPALYRGVTLEDGERGSQFWPLPMELLRLPADGTAGRVHVLAHVLGPVWRADWISRKTPPPVARIGSEKLGNYLAVTPQSGKDGTPRRRDPRAAEGLRRALDAGKDCGLLRSWGEEPVGSLDRFECVIVAVAGDQAVEMIESGKFPRPGRIPSSGDELYRWIVSTGTYEEVGEKLSVPSHTLRRVCSTHRGRPLPVNVRQALRRYLWPKSR